MISSDEKTKKLSIQLLEHPDYNSGVLANTNSMVEYDILLWDGKGSILAKKSGKVSRKNLPKSLSFDVPDLTGQKIGVSLSISSTIEGNKTQFITISSDNDQLVEFIQNSVDSEINPYLFTDFSFQEKADEYRIGIFTITQSNFDDLYLKTIGSSRVVLGEELSNLESSILEAERAVRKLNSLKQQSLGVNAVLEDELMLLEALNKSGVYETITKLVTVYETSGLLSISEYRQRLYTNLKPIKDNLTIAKGRLEKITEALKMAELPVKALG